MTTFTIQAVYQGGVLQPKVKLNLPDNTPVQVQVTPLPINNAPTSSLFGAFPKLACTEFGSLAGIWADLSDDDVAHAQQTIAKSRQRSSRKVKQLTQRPVRGQRRG